MVENLIEGGRFGHFELARHLGDGEFAEVYEAYDTIAQRGVVLKVFSARCSQNPAFRQRLFQEARTIAWLRHPHVVPIHSDGEVAGRVYLTMQLIDGIDLHRWPSGSALLTPSHAIAIGRQIAEALDAAHAAGVIHGGVKPHNIVIAKNDHAFLRDFGVANAIREAELVHPAAAATSWLYLAPECFTGAPASARTDVYALTCVLYECITGAPPYNGDGYDDIARALFMSPVPQLSKSLPGVSADFAAAIARGMAKSPEERPGAASDLIKAAEDGLTKEFAGLPLHIGPHAMPPKDNAYLPVTWPGGVIKQLPFADLDRPQDLAVDAAGNLYVADGGRPGGVFKLAAGATKADRLPFGDFAPRAVAVDTDGAVYVSGRDAQRSAKWLKLAVGATEPTELSVPALRTPGDLAVDGSGNLYVIDWENSLVLKVQAHDHDVAALPCHGIRDLRGLTVDQAGNVYLTADMAGVESSNNWVFRIAPGASGPSRIPFSGLSYAHGVAVDAAGNIYVADNWAHRIVKLTADGTIGAQLPFPRIQGATCVAVDPAGNVYTVDSGNKWVIQLDVTNDGQ